MKQKKQISDEERKVIAERRLRNLAMRKYIKRCIESINDSVVTATANLIWMKQNRFDTFENLSQEDMVDALEFCVNWHSYDGQFNLGNPSVDSSNRIKALIKNKYGKAVAKVVMNHDSYTLIVGKESVPYKKLDDVFNNETVMFYESV
jgi:hypothetical protein